MRATSNSKRSSNSPRRAGAWKPPLFIAAGLALFIAICFLSESNEVEAVPALARKYETGCTQCHTQFPKLNEFGENFKQSGYQTPFANEASLNKIDVHDDSLSVLKELPIALRWTGALQSNDDPNPSSDLTFPEGLTLLSIGTLNKDVGFLIHHGIDSGLEKGYLVFNNLGNADLDLQIGQFEIMDNVFSGHRTLTRAGYSVYGTEVGEWTLGASQRGASLSGTLGSAVLAPRKKSNARGASSAGMVETDELAGLEDEFDASQSGSEVAAEEATVDFENRQGFFYQLAFINGNGGGHDEESGGHAHGSSVVVDNNDAKDFFVRGYQTFGKNSRIGAFGYFGDNRLTDSTTSTDFDNEFRRIGADVSVNFGSDVALLGTTTVPRWNLHALYVKGDDDHPELTTWNLDHDGGFVGLECNIDGRSVGSLRYDYVNSSDDATLDAGLLTLGYAKALWRNLKLGVEYTADLEDQSVTHPDEQDTFSIWVDAAF